MNMSGFTEERTLHRSIRFLQKIISLPHAYAAAFSELIAAELRGFDFNSSLSYDVQKWYIYIYI